ncbi:55bc0777-82dd-4f41-a044-be82bf082a8f [Sclerotinia trifoliorum]|uniref:55bc0777-82dd-4f41-a044-be82bf082a8f n=1 Tax=Sclerotinia trifoliorum TaxID=28548 RepID=A0A8H2ZS26_9HELO|nr:55bc0777-82dd-4f41-a044-be82bf082a8f [Sclerotinia trifoliorum]
MVNSATTEGAIPRIDDPGLPCSPEIDVYAANANVGENFQDHAISGMSSEFQTSRPEGQAELKYLLLTRKPNTESVIFEFVRYILASADKSSACYFVYAAYGSFGSDAGSAKNVTITKKTRSFLTIACELGHPLSRGGVHVKSSFGVGILTIHSQHCCKRANGKIRQTFAAFGIGLEAAKDYVRKTMISLRVDASMIPLIPRSDVQSTVYVVADRAASLIKLNHNIS